MRRNWNRVWVVLAGLVLGGIAVWLFVPAVARAREEARKAPWNRPQYNPDNSVANPAQPPGSFVMPSSTDARPSAALQGLGDLRPEDELWVIERPVDFAPAERTETPRAIELKARVAGKPSGHALPLKHTDVRARVSSFVASVKVAQAYHNPYSEKIEAVYVFPLPQCAAIRGFLMTIGERRVRGVIRKREEARRLYREAKKRGYVASLLTQERPNIFTQSVANIEPGRDVGIELEYLYALRYAEGEYEFVFPTVVGPRFNPPGTKDGIGAVARGTSGRSGQAAEVQYLSPGTRSGHRVAIRVDIDAGVEIEKVYSRSHAIRVQRPAPARATVALRPGDTVPNKDFVLRYKVAGTRLKTALLTHSGEAGNVFALVLQPPEAPPEDGVSPREVVFLLDCSGSMSGAPLAKLKEAVRLCLGKLGPADTFQMLCFASGVSRFRAGAVPATPENVRGGLAYVGRLRGGGGTMMLPGVLAALKPAQERERRRIVVLISDGFIGNEAQILAAVHGRLAGARVFTFGIGSSVNRYLLERTAKMGKGTAAFIGLEEDAREAVGRFHRQVSHPVLADIRIDWGAAAVRDVYPSRIPDLFVNRPLLVTGRCGGSGFGPVRVTGRYGAREHTYEVPVAGGGSETAHEGISGLWARRKIMELSDRETHSPSAELREEITKVALAHRLMSRYTAFSAVDDSRQTAGAYGMTVHVPVPVPDGVRYETTVQ